MVAFSQTSFLLMTLTVGRPVRGPTAEISEEHREKVMFFATCYLGYILPADFWLLPVDLGSLAEVAPGKFLHWDSSSFTPLPEFVLLGKGSDRLHSLGKGGFV